MAIRKLDSQVVERIGVGRKIMAVRSGVVIPAEMVNGQTAAAFNGDGVSVVAITIMSKLGSLLR